MQFVGLICVWKKFLAWDIFFYFQQICESHVQYVWSHDMRKECWWNGKSYCLLYGDETLLPCLVVLLLTCAWMRRKGWRIFWMKIKCHIACVWWWNVASMKGIVVFDVRMSVMKNMKNLMLHVEEKFCVLTNKRWEHIFVWKFSC